MKIRNGMVKPLIFILAIAAAVVLAALNPGAVASADTAAIAPFDANITIAGNISSKVYTTTPTNLNATYSRNLAEGESVSYSWYKMTGENNETEELIAGAVSSVLPLVNVADTGIYKVKIKIYNEEYEREAEATKEFTITPRPAVVTWDKDTQLIYNGEPQVPAPQARGYNGVLLDLNVFGHASDAGSGYIAYVTCDDPNYTLSGETTYTFSILPREVDADWSGSPSRFIYNGAQQAPEAVVRDINGEILPSVVLGWSTNVNTTGYPATVVISDPNYKVSISSATTRFYIDPLEVEVVWDSLEILYTGSPLSPTATATGVNGYNIPLNFTGSGVESGGNYSVLATTLDINYILLNAQTTFTIIPRPVTAEWILPSAGFTYNTRDQSVSITAQYTRPDSTLAPLLITIEQDGKVVAFRNAGTYTVRAVMPESVTNYVLDEDGTHLIEVTINKAKPVITADNRRPVFTYNGEEYEIEVSVSADVEPILVVDERRVDNSFKDAGVYAITIITDESANYLPANPVSVILTINDIYFDTGSGSDYFASIVYKRGISPSASLVLREISDKDLPRYEKKWDRNVLAAYELSFDVNGETSQIRGKSEVLFRLPDKFADMETVKVLYYNNGAYREQTAKNVDGYIEIELSQNGYFAIFETNARYILMWWTAIGGVIIVAILAITIHYVEKNKRIG